MLALILLTFYTCREDIFALRLLISSIHRESILFVLLVFLNSSFLGDIYNNQRFCDFTCSAYVELSLRAYILSM